MVKSFLVMGLAALSWINVVPQSKTPSKPRARTPNVSISGTSSDEKHFVSDADMKFWNVTNPDVLKGHACEHVRITGQINSNTIVVKSVEAVMSSTHVMPSNNDYQLNRLPDPFPDYLKRQEIPTK